MSYASLAHHTTANFRSTTSATGVNDLPEVCDCAALSRFLHVDIKTVQGLAQRREIPCRKVGKAYRFFRPAILAWLCDQSKDAAGVRGQR